MAAAATPLESLDVISPESYAAHGYPHPSWARLRREAPVFRVTQPGFDPFYAITKHADIVAISKQPELFRSAPRLAMMHDSVRPSRAELADPSRPRFRMLLNMDNPDHRVYRRLTSRWFTPAALARRAPRIEAIARRIVDTLAAGGREGECDFVTAVAARLPLKVIAEILGVPEEDEDLVLELSNQGIGAQDPEFQKAGYGARESRRDALVRLFRYFTALAADRRGHPSDDLSTVLATATLGGAPLPATELLSYFSLIAVAGHETTRNATSGGMAALLHRQAWRRLRRETSLVDRAVEEILRWTSPVIQFCRTPVRDVTLRDRRIRAGEHLVLFYPSANRDEEVFDEPDRFVLDRAPNPHIAFGIGEHVCLGANLARLELRILFRELARRVEHVEAAGPAQFLASSFVGGIKHLPLRYRMAAGSS
jgi:cytochrome P450